MNPYNNPMWLVVWIHLLVHYDTLCFFPPRDGVSISPRCESELGYMILAFLCNCSAIQHGRRDDGLVWSLCLYRLSVLFSAEYCFCHMNKSRLTCLMRRHMWPKSPCHSSSQTQRQSCLHDLWLTADMKELIWDRKDGSAEPSPHCQLTVHEMNGWSFKPLSFKPPSCSFKPLSDTAIDNWCR